MPIATSWFFLILGLFFLALGLLRWATARRLVPQARTWLIAGTIFSVVAAWLWHRLPVTG